MRVSPIFNDTKICPKCEREFTPTGPKQIYCPTCKVIEDKIRKQRWYVKHFPDAYKEKPERYCAICGEKADSAINDVLYCTKHYQSMHRYGTPEYIRQPKNVIETIGDTSKLTTPKGEEILIDTEFLPIASKHSWCVSKTGYAVSNINGKVTKLHRYLFNPPVSVVMDHINGNKLDCRKRNLRICEILSNSRNLKVKRNNSSGYPGIDRLPSGKYRVRITVNRKEISVGHYSTLIEALDARLAAELKHYGSFAPSLGVLKDLVQK